MRAEPITTPASVKTGWKCIDDRTLTADMLRGDKEAQEAFINALTSAELNALPFDWGFWARDDQLPPRDWITQKIVDEKAGKGVISLTKRNLTEIIQDDRLKGFDFNLDKHYQATNKAKIHYSKTGVHLVPTLKELKND